MKMKIDGKDVEVSFWSFLKGYICSWAFITALIGAILWIIGVLVAE